MHFVYVLQNTDKSLYIGYTTDIKRRVEEHQSGKGGRTTKNKLKRSSSSDSATKLWELIYYEAYINKQDALGREKFL